MNTRLVCLLASSLIVVLASCGGTTPPPAPPNFSMSSQTFPNQAGGQCLGFTGVSSENVIVIRVDITNPINQNIVFVPAGAGQVFPSGIPFDLQTPPNCYEKRSGNWRFTFTGNRPGGAGFTSVATLQVVN